MEKANLGEFTLEFEASSAGEPVLFIHGSFIADTFTPLLAWPGFPSGLRAVSYHRRGYMGSTRPERVLSIAEQAADCMSLLGYLGIGRVHVVGHSLGGAIALQLALDAPDLVHTLALLEPAVAVGESGRPYRASLANAIQIYRENGPAVALDGVMTARWPSYETPLEEALPGAFKQAVADAPNVFEHELPGLLDWEFAEPDAPAITQPTLSVLGGGSETLSPRFGEAHRTLCRWLANAEPCVIPQATHFMQVEKPRDMAAALRDFLERHPTTA